MSEAGGAKLKKITKATRKAGMRIGEGLHGLDDRMSNVEAVANEKGWDELWWTEHPSLEKKGKLQQRPLAIGDGKADAAPSIAPGTLLRDPITRSGIVLFVHHQHTIKSE